MPPTNEVRRPPVHAAAAVRRTYSTSNNTNSVFVQTRNSVGVPADHAFYVVVFG